jgi:hypothetical protein
MKVYDANATIEAAPEAVWAVLTDAPAYSQWDSGVVRVEGRIAPGEKIKVVSEANPKRTFPVEVTEFTPAQKMTWSGGMPLGLFKGVRTFTLLPQGGGTRFTMREEYTGPLLPLIWRSMPDLGPSFEQFANGSSRRSRPVRGAWAAIPAHLGALTLAYEPRKHPGQPGHALDPTRQVYAGRVSALTKSSSWRVVQHS